MSIATVSNPNCGQGLRGFPKNQGLGSIGLRRLSVKPGSGEPPQCPLISRRCIAVSTTSARCSRTGVGPRLRTNESVIGKSGRAYRVAGIVLDEAQKEPVAFVAPAPNRAAVASQFAEFYDLRHAHSKVINESVYDEERDLRDEDRRLLGIASELYQVLLTETH